MPAAVALLLFFCSCTILEDRSGCPCILRLDLSDSSNSIYDTLMVSVRSEDGFLMNALVGREDYGKELLVKIPTREGVRVNVLQKEAMEYYSDPDASGLRIPPGTECPETYMYSDFCPTWAEESTDTVRLSKNYCGVSLKFVSNVADKFATTIVGNVCGYELDGNPAEGEFRYDPAFDEESASFFRLPRQSDSSLRLQITSADGSTRSFALGNYIIESGYDWSAPQLDDIVVMVDYVSTSVSITVNDWNIMEYFDVVI